MKKENDSINCYIIKQKKNWTETKIHTNGFKTWFSTINLYLNLI